MFTIELIQAISDWQRGGDAKQKRRRGERLKLEALKLPAIYRHTTARCYRQIALNNPKLLHLGTQFQLPETISAWTTSITVAKEFKGGVPDRLSYQALIFAVIPPLGTVVLNFPALFENPEFIAAVNQYRSQITGFGDGIGRYGNSQREVVIELSVLPLNALSFWGGFSSSQEKLGKQFFGRDLNTVRRKQTERLLKKAKVNPGECWLSDRDGLERAKSKLAAFSRCILAQRKLTSETEKP
jgi:hypothetical protein